MGVLAAISITLLIIGFAVIPLGMALEFELLADCGFLVAVVGFGGLALVALIQLWGWVLS